MKSQASRFSFGCLFFFFFLTKPLFYHRTKAAFFFRGGIGKGGQGNCQNKTTPNRPMPYCIPGWRQNRTWALQRLPNNPRPTPTPTNSVKGTWPQKQNLSETDFQKLTSASSLVSVQQQHSWVPRPRAPVYPFNSGQLQLDLSTSHSQNHFLCKTSSLRRKNALIVV